MRKFLIIAFTALTLLLAMTGCTAGTETDVAAGKPEKSDRLQIVATLFPQYDFARQIAGGKADITLLLPPGVESHSYEPTPSDMVKINESDLFLYTGKTMEAWSETIIDAIQDSGSDSLVLNVAEGIELRKTEDSDTEHEHEGEGWDPHIWTDPVNAKVMAANIRDALCRLDPANAEFYRKNAAAYSSELDALDAEFRSIVSGAKRDEILFGSRFALTYFMERYGLHYQAAFDSCSSETEPSARSVAGLIEEIRKNQVPVIYYAELEDPKVARAISTETGAKMLLFHSCHNVTKQEMENGATYLSLMRQNALNLKEGLE